MLTNAEGFVLAGGRSSRMGRDKAFVLVDGKPLVAKVADSLHRMTGKVTVIGRPGGLEMLRDVLPGGIGLLEDAVADQGPLMGVFTALLSARREFLIVLPCDMPGVTLTLIRKLQDGMDASTIACAGELPGDGWQPFPLVCRAAAARTVGALLDANRFALRDLLKGPGGRIIPVNEPELADCFRNLNTPDDLTRHLGHGLVAS